MAPLSGSSLKIGDVVWMPLSFAMAQFPWVLAMVSCALARAREASISATGNPHMSQMSQCAGEGCECPAQKQLDLSLMNLVPLQPVQADSFLGMEKYEAKGMEVNLYNFKQPARLSELQLPFKLVLLRTLDFTDLHVLEVPKKQALDSWFPGYAWSVLVCGRCEGRHLGWKFTPSASRGDADAFYALIVEVASAEERMAGAESETQLLGGLRAVGQPLAALGLAASALQSLLE